MHSSQQHPRLKAAALAAQTVSPRQLAIFVHLLANADADDVWRGKFETIAAALGVSWSSVARAVAELQRAQLVDKLTEHTTGAAWLVVWQKCHGKNAMATPPDPPFLNTNSVALANVPPPPTPARQRVAVDLATTTDASEHKRRAAALALVNDPATRAQLAANHSFAEITQALKMVGSARGARDTGALLVHVLRSNAARAEVERATEKHLVNMELEQMKNNAERERERTTQAAAMKRATEQAQARQLIIDAAPGDILGALTEALDESSMLRAIARRSGFHLSADVDAARRWIFANVLALNNCARILKTAADTCTNGDAG